MKNLFLILVLASLLFVSCMPVDNTAANNRAAAEKLTAEAWNKGNFDGMDQLMTADFVRHNPASWEPPVIEGLEAFKTYLTGVRTMYPDFKVTAHSRVSENDMVATSWTVSGTHSELGKTIDVNGMTMTRYQDGKAAEEWVTWDTQGLAEQLQAE